MDPIDPNEKPPDRNNQIDLLFKQDKHMGEAIAVMNQRLENQEKMLAGINKSVTALEEIQKDTHLVVFGNKDMGIDGLVQSDKKQEEEIGTLQKYAWKIGCGIVVAVWFVKEFGLLDALKQ